MANDQRNRPGYAFVIDASLDYGADPIQPLRRQPDGLGLNGWQVLGKADCGQ
jgi:hypothetical protein